MSFASWFRLPKFPFYSALNRPSSRRIVRRQPLRPRLFLESLEARVLLDASSGVIGGGLDNLTINTSLGSTGIVLPVSGSGPHATGLSGLSASGYASLGASGSFSTQDQPNSQLRIFAVNSQGDDARLGLRTMTGMLGDAYGFGSGVQPNAPWKPAAYNLGLANHQFDYPSQIDNGYGSVPPWYHEIASEQAEFADTDETEQGANLEFFPLLKSDKEDQRTKTPPLEKSDAAQVAELRLPPSVQRSRRNIGSRSVCYTHLPAVVAEHDMANESDMS